MSRSKSASSTTNPNSPSPSAPASRSRPSLSPARINAPKPSPSCKRRSRPGTPPPSAPASRRTSTSSPSKASPPPPSKPNSSSAPPDPLLPSLKGKPVILFFWAHWCADCKQQGPILARLQQEHKATDLVILGPTQKYGYIAGGVDAPPAEELPYIERIRTQFYGALNMSVPVSEENFKAWGCSTTPTLALIDRAGIVRLYHPGRMTYEDLAPKVAALLKR
ncbi:MAG: redoxin domain-containing protein [Bryobacterales bacterium]|nr:redoxin domain-containing protein [Bryobacterales bacterium]